jgi:hypothetical protein
MTMKGLPGNSLPASCKQRQLPYHTRRVCSLNHREHVLALSDHSTWNFRYVYYTSLSLQWYIFSKLPTFFFFLTVKLGRDTQYQQKNHQPISCPEMPRGHAVSKFETYNETKISSAWGSCGKTVWGHHFGQIGILHESFSFIIAIFDYWRTRLTRLPLLENFNAQNAMHSPQLCFNVLALFRPGSVRHLSSKLEEYCLDVRGNSNTTYPIPFCVRFVDAAFWRWTGCFLWRLLSWSWYTSLVLEIVLIFQFLLARVLGLMWSGNSVFQGPQLFPLLWRLVFTLFSSTR